MKRLISLALLLCLAVPVQAGYFEFITDVYDPGLTLQTGDSLYMTDGGIGILTLNGESTAIIEGTSELEDGFGGIWVLSLSGESHLDFSGGQVHMLSLNSDATAILSGGLIEEIYSTQPIWNDDFDPAVQISDPHITMYYSGDLPTVEVVDGFDFLVGNWMDGTDFNIYLHDTGYDAYGNIQFIPEPATIFLVTIGGVLLRRKSALYNK
jgi:hypothetical protein